METTEIIGWAVTAVALIPLVMGAILNIFKLPQGIKNIEHIGFPLSQMPAFGYLKVIIIALILIPATAFLGTILVTGYMGGAIAAHVRIKDKFIIQTLIPILLWVGFGLRHQAEMHSLLGF